MGSWYKLFLYALRRDLLRVVLTVLSVALGVASMLAIRLANSAAVESFRKAALTVNSQADLVITKKQGQISADEFLRLERLALPHGSVSPLRVDYIKIGQKLIKAYGVDFITSSDSLNDIRFEIPSFREILKPHSLLLTKALQESLGEVDEVLTSKGVVEATLVGYFDPGQPAKYALVDLSQLEYFFGDSALSRVELSLKEENSLEQTKQALQNALPGYVVQSPLETLGGREKMVRAFHFNMSSLGYISVLVGMLVVLTVTTLSLRRRTYQLGVLKTLGATSRELKRLFLLENVILGVPSIFIGIFLGSQAASFLIAASAETTAVFYLAEAAQGALEKSQINGLEVTFVTLLTLAAIYLATELSTKQLDGISEIALLRSQQRPGWSLQWYNLTAALLFVSGSSLCFLPPVGGLPIFGFFASICFLLFGVFLFPQLFEALLWAFSWISQKTPSRFRAVGLTALSGSRTGLALIIPAASSLIVSMAMTIAVLFMVGSFRQTVELWIEGALTADLVLRPSLNDLPRAGGRISHDFLSKAATIAGVTRIEPVLRQEIEFEGKSIDLVTRQLSQDLPFFFKKQMCTKEFVDGKAILVSETFALRFKKKMGDTITILGKGFPICGLYYDYAGVRGEVYLAAKAYKGLKALDGFTSAAVFVNSEIEPVKQALFNILENPLELLMVETNWLRSEVLRIFDQTFVITYAVLTLSLIIAGLGVFAAIVILGMGQRSSLTMFRSLGASRKQVIFSLLFQTSLLAVASFIAALVAGLLIGYVLAEVINPQSFFWTISLRVEFFEVLKVFFIFFATALVASGIAVAMVLNLNIRDISRDE